VVVDGRGAKETRKTTLRSEWRSALKKSLTEPALLEMFGKSVRIGRANSPFARKFRLPPTNRQLFPSPKLARGGPDVNLSNQVDDDPMIFATQEMLDGQSLNCRFTAVGTILAGKPRLDTTTG
jgi:hypothetical protein